MADEFDAVVIGGGITGAGVYRELRRRGLNAVVVEALGRLGNATTWNSSCLIHGGLRYLVYDPDMTEESCRDAGRILEEFPGLLTRLPFLWPVYEGDRHGPEKIETLLEIYDRFSHLKGAHRHLRFSAETTLRIEPGLEKEGLLGSICFEEWLVDPRRLTEAVAASAPPGGGTILKDRRVVGIIVEKGRARGVRLDDGRSLRGRWVINAAGPWADRVASLARAEFPLRLRKGVHLLYPARMTRCAILVEAVDHKRFIFSIPGGSATLLGPTDTPFSGDPANAEADAADVEYLSRSLRRIFPGLPEKHVGVRVGVRPIIGQSGPEAFLSRDFEVSDHEERDGVAGLITVAGGKMTTFPSMAEAVGRMIRTKRGDAAAPAGGHRAKLTRLFSGISSLGSAYGLHQFRRLSRGREESTYEDFEESYGRP